MATRKRMVFSERVDLIKKSREAALAAVQIFNSPLATFKSESFIVLFMIAWTYLLHAYYRGKSIDYRFYDQPGKKKVFVLNSDGSIKYWDLSECISRKECPLDSSTVNNLRFLIGLRNQIEHKKADNLDSYLSARYQACALNYNYYLKILHGETYSLDRMLALSLQFAELDYEQAKTIKDKEGLIPREIRSYIAKFDDQLSEEEMANERFSYRLLFAKVAAKREGQADRVVEFLDPDSPLAETIKKEYWVKEDREKKKYQAKEIVAAAKSAGYKNFNTALHTRLWRKFDAKNPSKGYGLVLGGLQFWYENWKDKVLEFLRENDGIVNL
jgi:hypothetical protein